MAGELYNMHNYVPTVNHYPVVPRHRPYLLLLLDITTLYPYKCSGDFSGCQGTESGGVGIENFVSC